VFVNTEFELFVDLMLWAWVSMLIPTGNDANAYISLAARRIITSTSVGIFFRILEDLVLTSRTPTTLQVFPLCQSIPRPDLYVSKEATTSNR
jgi:hypothetical protein